MPRYFCNQSTAAVRAAGVAPVFYPVTAVLGPDWAACRDLARAGTPDIFVAVHFFGFAFDMEPAVDFCRNHGAWLVEDAAHVLRPHGGIGETGDHVFYSPYKFLPVPDAGLLLSRHGDAAPSAIPRHAPGYARWMMKRLLQRSLPRVAAAMASAPPGFDDDPEYAPLPVTPGLSPAARRILTRRVPRLAETAADRRRCADSWIANLGRVNPALRPFLEDRHGPCPVPYRCVVDAGDATTARAAYAALSAAGIPVGTWPDLAPEVADAPGDHVVALRLRQSLLLLPVHLEIDFADLESHLKRP